MKNLFFPLLIGGSILLTTACAKIYHTPDARTRASSHQTIAIAPPKVSIAARKKVDAEAMKEQQKTESDNFQREMYSWLLKRKMQGKIHVEILDVETTNAKLERAGYFTDTILTPNEIMQVLNVDGLLTSNFSLTKPMSEGAAVAVGLLTGAWGATNAVTVTLSIHDHQTNKMIWNYNHKLSGNTFTTPAKIVDNLMRHSTKKMPYKM